jgi:glucose-6-phosphate isomerase, archaeal
MQTNPYSFQILPGGKPTTFSKHVKRNLSTMNGQYLDKAAYDLILSKNDILSYEVYELSRPETPGELIHGVSILHPGKVGSEYFMTKGHFHTVIDTSEIYYCLQGSGYMILETPEGETSIEKLFPGSILYVPPRWAHRSVNINSHEDLITFFAYPANAGHDYGSIEVQGFRKLVLDREGQPVTVDNPRWLSPSQRKPL